MIKDIGPVDLEENNEDEYVIIEKKTSKRHLWRGKGDLHLKTGYIKEEELRSEKTIVKDHKGNEFFKYPARFTDKIQKIKRGPQIITPKDIGYIVVRVGLSKDSIIVEAGSGSGSATVYMSRFVKEVHTYERNKTNFEIVNQNLDFLKINNVKIKNLSLEDEIKDEKNFDFLFLDLPEPIEILKNDISGLKIGKFICCYLPSISQVEELCDYVYSREDLYLEEVSEIIKRDWKVIRKSIRPQNRKEIDFTAFLVFIRKIS